MIANWIEIAENSLKPPKRNAMKYLYHADAFSPENKPNSYWADTASPIPPCPKLIGDDSCEIAVIGSGYTGMMAAYHLATRYNMDVRVVEAAQPGWGASGRNGGFCCMGGSKLSYQQMLKRYGLEDTKDFFQAQKDSVSFVGSFLKEHQIDVDETGKGEISLAHKANRMQEFKEEQEFLKSIFNYDTTVLSPSDLETMGLKGQFYGGLHNPTGFGLHPLKYALGLADLLGKSGIKIYGDSPVVDWTRQGSNHLLRTSGGTLRAKQVILATNGYTAENISPATEGKLLPALSSILVTRKLTKDELASQGWTNTTTVYDSRTLLHYFRLLPDGRFLFGGRGGTDASLAGSKSSEKVLRREFEQLFPRWASIKHTHFWQGFVCLANDLVPFIGTLDKDKTTWGAFAYHGNGVAMGSWAGQALADEIVGKKKSSLPSLLCKNFNKFPLPSLRVQAIKAAYLYYHIKDEWL